MDPAATAFADARDHAPLGVDGQKGAGRCRILGPDARAGALLIRTVEGIGGQTIEREIARQLILNTPLRRIQFPFCPGPSRPDQFPARTLEIAVK